MDSFPEIWEDKEQKLLGFGVFRGHTPPREPRTRLRQRVREEGSIFKPPKREFGQSREQQPQN